MRRSSSAVQKEGTDGGGGFGSSAADRAAGKASSRATAASRLMRSFYQARRSRELCVACAAVREVVGPYKIVRPLGEGGMGAVYEAEDARLGRRVALKTLLPASADPGARDRLWREARAGASVNHPNVCQVYDVGEADGELYVAMELLEGEPLSTRLARGPMPAPEALALALGMLGALEALHGKGVLHRDLKPSNVFLTPHGVKLLDFGLAGSIHGVGEPTHLTRPDMVVGTPHYVSPEQLEGREVDGRSDLFAVGAVLYEMRAGKQAF